MILSVVSYPLLFRGVPLPGPVLAVLGVRPYGCPRLRSRISVCRSIASRFARASRRFVAAARLPPVPPAALRRRLLVARAAVRRSSLRARGACPIKRQFFSAAMPLCPLFVARGSDRQAVGCSTFCVHGRTRPTTDIPLWELCARGGTCQGVSLACGDCAPVALALDRFHLLRVG